MLVKVRSFTNSTNKLIIEMVVEKEIDAQKLTTYDWGVITLVWLAA